MKRRRIIFLTGSLRLGGTERNIVHLATHLDRRRFEVEVWSDYEGEPLQADLRRRNILCRALKGAPSLGQPLLTRLVAHNIPYQRRLLKMLRVERDAVIHAFGFPMAYYAVLLGRLAGCRRIIFAVQDWDVWKRSGIYGLLDRVCSRLAWRVVADGEGARRLAASHQGMDPRKLVTIYDGVNVEELRPQRPPEDTRKTLGLSPGRPTVGVIARLDLAKKGQDVFLKALPGISATVPEAQFLLVGDGPDREEIERLAEALPPGSRPVLAGSRTDLADVLAALDILVIPSRWESVPKILLEGMWMKKAVVATRVGDIPEILDETCGVLVEPDDPAGIACAVSRLLAGPLVREKPAGKAHARINERGLTLAASVRAYERLYCEA